MPDEKKTADTAPVAAPTDPAATPAPAYATMAELTASETRQAGRFEEVNRNLAQIAAALAQNRNPQPQQQAPARVARPSDTELAESLSNGNTEPLKRLLAAEREDMLRVMAENINPLQQVGTSAISALTERVMRAEMPHYALLKPEIEKKLAMLDPSLRMQPEAIANLYNLVAGENIDKIVNAAVEAKLREARGNPDGNADGKGTERGVNGPTSANEALTKEFAAEVGAEAMQALKARNQTPEQFVARLGYKDLETYLKAARPEGSAS